MKKVGKFLLCLLPLIVFLGIQLILGVAGGIGAGFIVGVEAGMKGLGNDIAFITQRTQEMLAVITPIVAFISHLIAVVVGFIWVYHVFGKNKPGNPVKAFSWMTLAVLALCAVGLQYSCSNALNVVEIINPALMENYNKLMETAGLTAMNPFAIIASVCLAPFGEELLFRGVTFRLAKNAGLRFWAANILQAACFGIGHMNVVQGIYAFFLGILLGYIYEKYNSLYVPILLHAIFNLLGTVVGYVLESILGESTAEPALISCVIAFVVFAAMLAIGIVLIKKDKKACHQLQDKGEGEYAAL